MLRPNHRLPAQPGASRGVVVADLRFRSSTGPIFSSSMTIMPYALMLGRPRLTRLPLDGHHELSDETERAIASWKAEFKRQYGREPAYEEMS
jgi:hypothetical protein